MRLNIQGWNSLALDGMPLDRELDVATYAIFEKHLGPIRARALSEIAWFWISSGEKRARPSRILDVRYYAAKRKAMCRLMLAPTARSASARTRQYLKDMARLTGVALEQVTARVAAQGASIDLTRAGNSIARDVVRLATPARRR